jgi:hypothetical protein
MSAVMRHKELRQRRARKEKLSKLREHYAKAKTEGERAAVLDKAHRVAPWLSQDEFLSPLNSSAS